MEQKVTVNLQFYRTHKNTWLERVKQENALSSAPQTFHWIRWKYLHIHLFVKIIFIIEN